MSQYKIRSSHPGIVWHYFFIFWPNMIAHWIIAQKIKLSEIQIMAQSLDTMNCQDAIKCLHRKRTWQSMTVGQVLTGLPLHYGRHKTLAYESKIFISRWPVKTLHPAGSGNNVCPDRHRIIHLCKWFWKAGIWNYKRVALSLLPWKRANSVLLQNL